MLQSPAQKQASAATTATTTTTAPISTTSVFDNTNTTTTNAATSTTATSSSSTSTSKKTKQTLSDEQFAFMDHESVSLVGTSYDLTNNDDDGSVNGNTNHSLPALRSLVASAAGSQRYNQAASVQDGQKTFEQLIKKSTLSHADTTVQRQGIIAAFNRDVQGNPLKEKNFVTIGGVRGKKISPGKFKIYHTNNIPFIVGPTTKLVAPAIYVQYGTTCEEIGEFDQNARYFSANGVHVINVPPGQIAKITDGSKRELLGEGVHVIHSQTLHALVEQDFVKISEPFIQHGNITILRIPVGKIATVTKGNTPVLLDGRSEPHIFDDPTFFLTKKDADTLFYDSTEKLIVHGTVKRLLPHNGEVAVTYNGSQLEIVAPREDGDATTITDPNHSVPKDTFLQVNLNAVTYPNIDEVGNEFAYATSRDGVAVKMRMNINYSIKDPKLAVSALARADLSAHDAILKHVESCALTDMTQVVQNSNYYEAQETSHSNSSSTSTNTEITPAVVPEYFENMQDKIRIKLKEELLEKGIVLTRLQFLQFSCADEKVKISMAENAQRTQKVYADVSMLQQNGVLNRETAIQTANVKRIEKEGELERARLDALQQLVTVEGKANQDATVLRIKQQQANDNVLSAARTELEAAKIRTEAMKVTAQAEADAIRVRGEAELAVLRLKAQLFQEFPAWLQYNNTELQAKALAGIQSMVVSSDAARSVYAVGTPAFFSPNPDARQMVQAAIAQGNANHAPAVPAPGSASR